MHRYKQYLEIGNNNPVPRKTEYRRRQFAGEFSNDQCSDESSLGDFGNFSALEHSYHSTDENNHFSDSYSVNNYVEENSLERTVFQTNDSYAETARSNSASDDDSISVARSTPRTNRIHSMDIDVSTNIDTSSDSHDDFGIDDGDNDDSDSSNVMNDTNETEDDSYLSKALCNFLTCTRGDVLLMVMSLGLRHLLSWEAIVDILKMVNVIFNDPVVPASKYYLHKYFPSNIKNGVYHIYCPNCHKYLGTRDDIENNVNCICGRTLDVHRTQSYFLQFDIRDQFYHLIKNRKFVENLNYRYTRVKKNEAAIEDVFDGKKYKEKSHVFNNNMNLSYTFNTDGCQAADSSNVTIWPIYMMLHDLPPNERKKSMLLAGLWVDKVEPDMNIFLESFVNQANDLSSVGITWSFDNQEITSKLIPLVCSVDSVARCKMLNMKQYNGYFGCTFCMHPCETVDRQRKYTISTKVHPLRTDKSIKTTMIEACSIGKLRTDIFGIWGPSSLMNLSHFDLADGMYVDHLHATLIGAAYQLTDIWLTSVSEEYYIGAPHHQSKINKRLLLFCPPTVITRTPRILKDRKLWKASEWQDWLLLYSLICLQGILKKKYFEHWALFVAAMNILLQDSITSESLDQAEVLMIKFVMGFQHLYGKIAMNYNIHLLLHICRSVRSWGPLWAHSTFPFENLNKFLLSLKHSPARLIPQMSQRFLSFQKVRSFPEKTKINENVLNFCESLFDRSLKFFSRIDNCVLLGKGKIDILTERELVSLNHCIDNCRSYNKLIHEGTRYFTASYHATQCRKQNDSVVLLKSGQIGQILKIYKVSYEFQEKVIMFINLFDIERDYFLSTKEVNVDHIKQCSSVNNIQIFSPADLLRPCVYIKTKQSEYVILIPFGCYGD